MIGCGLSIEALQTARRAMNDLWQEIPFEAIGGAVHNRPDRGTVRSPGHPLHP